MMQTPTHNSATSVGVQPIKKVQWAGAAVERRLVNAMLMSVSCALQLVFLMQMREWPCLVLGLALSHLNVNYVMKLMVTRYKLKRLVACCCWTIYGGQCQAGISEAHASCHSYIQNWLPVLID